MSYLCGKREGDVINLKKTVSIQLVGGELVVRRNREFKKVLGRDASSDNFLKKQLS